MESQGHAHLVASGSSYKSVYLVEIQRRQLVHDDAHRDVLPLACIHSGDKTVQDKGVQRTDNALHLRVVGDEQVARILRIAHLQVKVITVTVEYPVRFLGRQTGRIDTQRTDHTFQLLHGLVPEGGLERPEQRCHLVVSLQYLKDGLITFVQER